MSFIRILPEKISNKIAAGEVIERPASVVKELVENSIDASARNIYINIENSGKKLIAVVDDGVGMDSDDALLCLEAHATSKILKEDDINNIVTMGFRGEAIPSIASISRFRIRTRKQDMVEGTEVVVHGGRFISENPIGCAPGTEIRISDLFFNTPARKKFLKSAVTEEKHIHEALCLLALANPEIAFELKMDGRTVISTPADKDILPRLGAFLGNHTVSSMIPVDFENSGIKVSGYISAPGFVKNNRREQRVFINGRPIKTNIAYSAIRDAYDTMIMKGSYPVATLYVKLNPGDVDINVHPAKHEARFRNERLMSSVIRQGISEALRKAIKPVSAVSTQKLTLNSILQGAEVSYFEKDELNIESVDVLPVQTATTFGNPKIRQSTTPSAPGKHFEKPSMLNSNLPKNSALDLGFASDEKVTGIDKNYSFKEKKISLPGSGNINVLGNLDDTYILGTSDIGLIIIDQHAAHERILYEKLLNNFPDEPSSQKLLIPITVSLNRIEANIINKKKTVFSKLGFEIEPFGEDTVMVTAIPPDFPMDNISGLISDLLDEIISNGDSVKKIDDSVIAGAACKLAVKAHDKVSTIEATELIQRLSKCNLPFTCPHGRPTVINISFKELEKRFGRKL